MRFRACGAAAACLLLLAVHAGAGDLARTDAALEAWLERIDADRPFLLLDLDAGEVRLQHGVALLRRCPVAAVAVDGQVAVVQRLRFRLRRYGAEPFQPLTAGPFDWEQYLVRAADDDDALVFDGGLLVYGDDAWDPPPPPSVRLAATDLRALFDAVADSVDLVVLPVGWAEPAAPEEADRR